jgi:hypothetical protein
MPVSRSNSLHEECLDLAGPPAATRHVRVISDALCPAVRLSNHLCLAPLKKGADGAWHLSKTLLKCQAPGLRKLLSRDPCLIPTKKCRPKQTLSSPPASPTRISSTPTDRRVPGPEVVMTLTTNPKAPDRRISSRLSRSKPPSPRLLPNAQRLPLSRLS